MALLFGVAERVEDPKSFFKLNPEVFEQVVSTVRAAFGRDTDKQDIYEHVTSPEDVYLLTNNGKIIAMASYNSKNISGIPCLIPEGMTVVPEFQGKGIFN